MRSTLAITLAVFALGLAVPAIAAAEHAGHGADHGAAPAAAAMTEGLVKKVDKSAGKLTLAHGALPNGMPAMTMAFAVKEPAWLKQIKTGDRIRFAVDDAMTIVRLERM